MVLRFFGGWVTFLRISLRRRGRSKRQSYHWNRGSRLYRIDGLRTWAGVVVGGGLSFAVGMCRAVVGAATCDVQAPLLSFRRIEVGGSKWRSFFMLMQARGTLNRCVDAVTWFATGVVMFANVAIVCRIIPGVARNCRSCLPAVSTAGCACPRHQIGGVMPREAGTTPHPQEERAPGGTSARQ